MIDLDDPRDLDLPPGFANYPAEHQVQYLTTNLTRDQLFRAVVLRVELDEVDPDDVSATARFNKRQLALIARRLRAFRSR